MNRLYICCWSDNSKLNIIKVHAICREVIPEGEKVRGEVKRLGTHAGNQFLFFFLSCLRPFFFQFSHLHRGKYKPDRSELYNYGLAWAEFVRRGREASAVAKDRYYEVHYENLITEPYKELRNIVDFCELEWYSKFEEKIPPTQNMNEKWKQKASKEQHTDLEESTYDLRQTLGMAE